MSSREARPSVKPTGSTSNPPREKRATHRGDPAWTSRVVTRCRCRLRGLDHLAPAFGLPRPAPAATPSRRSGRCHGPWGALDPPSTHGPRPSVSPLIWSTSSLGRWRRRIRPHRRESHRRRRPPRELRPAGPTRPSLGASRHRDRPRSPSTRPHAPSLSGARRPFPRSSGPSRNTSSRASARGRPSTRLSCSVDR